ncbi:MAG: hypothetical protein ACRD4O_01635 [Bryobacteraceae bacterium]
MKKIVIAALALSLLPVGAVFAQSQDGGNTMSSTTKKGHHHKKKKKKKSKANKMGS